MSEPPAPPPMPLPARPLGPILHGAGWTAASLLVSPTLGLSGLVTFVAFKVLAWRVWLGQLRPRAFAIAALTLFTFAMVMFVWERLMMPTILLNVILTLLASLFVLEGFVATILAIKFDRGRLVPVAAVTGVAAVAYAVVLFVFLDIPGGYGP